MKRIISVILAVSLVFGVCSCSKKKDKKDKKPKETKVEKDITSESEGIVEVEDAAPSVIEIRNVCQLATMDCYFHNVCKGVKQPGTGLSHLGEQERVFWFEYTAEATLGIDFSQVEIIVKGNHITVYYPHAEIIGDIRVDSSSTSDPICGYESEFQNTNYITAEDVTAALGDANEEIRQQILNDRSFTMAAEMRAEELIGNYIDQIMDQSGVEYTYEFKYIEDYQADLLK